MRIGPDSVGPSNYVVPFDHFGGYHYTDTYIRMFSHTHLVGAGVIDLGTIGVMPITLRKDEVMTPSHLDYLGFRSLFSHDNETAKPYHYSVHLHRWNVLAELTSTQWVGVHRYTFKNNVLSNQRN